MFGRQPRLPVDVLMNLKHPKVGSSPDHSEFANSLQKKFEKVYSLVETNIQKAGRHQKKGYDKKMRGAVPQIGDRVLLKRVGFTGKHKLENRWEEEVYVILEQPHENIPVYRIQREDGKGRVKTVHRNLLFPLALPVGTDQKTTKAISRNDPHVEPPRVEESNTEDEQDVPTNVVISIDDQVNQTEDQEAATEDYYPLVDDDDISVIPEDLSSEHEDER